MKWHFGIEGPWRTSSFSTLLPSLSEQSEGRHCSWERETSLCIENQHKKGELCAQIAATQTDGMRGDESSA